MLVFSLHRWLSSAFAPASCHSRSESRPPPAPWRWQARPARGEELADARLDFAQALFDVRTAAAIAALDRVAIARSLHALWHSREEVFSLVALRHGQAEAARRLAGLDRHFPRRRVPAGFIPATGF